MLPDLQAVHLSAREPISSEVTRRLMDYLTSGQIQPGGRLPSERQLAETLGVGRSHVRQAIKSLAVLGLIDVRQGDGTFLKRTDSPLLPLAIEWGLLLGAKQSRDLVEARSYLEVVVAELAAGRRTDEQLAAMRARLETMQRTTDNEEFVEADVAFHLQITEAAGNRSLLQMMKSIRSLLEVWISRVAHAPGSRPATWAEHAAVFDAIARGDPAAAREAMEGHMAGAMDRLRHTFPEPDAASNGPVATAGAPTAASQGLDA